MSVEISITDQIVEINEVSNPVEISVNAGAAVAEWGSITGTLSNQTDLQNALDDKVPYTGATANVDLGEFELKAGQLELDQTPTGTAGVAVTRWNDSVGTIETTLKGGSVVLKHGRDMFERVVNKTGIQLTRAAYQAVRVSDAQGQRLAVQLAQANNDNNSADTIGLVVETIDNNQEGYIYTVGEIDNINTTGSLQGETWADGDVLYLSPTTAGRITNIKPVAPQHLVVIGYVVYAHANNGKIYVKVMNGWELGELHDVDTTGATNGQVLKYNGTIWAPAADSGITGTGTTGTIPIYTGATTIGNSIVNVTSGLVNISGSGNLSDYGFQIGTGRTNNGFAYIDLVGDATYSDYGFRILRNNTGANATSVIEHRGTGDFIFKTVDNANLYFQTGSTNRVFVEANGGALNVANTSAVFLANTGEQLIVNGAAKFSSSITASSFIRSGGTSSQYLMADGSTSTLTNPVTGTGVSGQVSYWSGTNTQTGSNNLFWDNANARLGIGTNAPSYITHIVSNGNNEVAIQSIANGTSATLRLISPSNYWQITNGGASAFLTFNRGGTNHAQFTNTGNLILQNGGTFTDSGQRLQVTGDTLMRGSGNTSATTALTVQNSDGTTMLSVRNDNRVVAVNGIITGSTGSFSGLFPNGGSTGFEGVLLRTGLLPSVAGTDIQLDNVQGTPAITSGTRIFLLISRGFNPTSGTGVYNMFTIAPNSINQTGGANGITRGLYVNPTLTAAADWRSIEWSNNTGWGLYGAGTSNNYLAGSLAVGGTNVFATIHAQGNTFTGTNQTILFSQVTILNSVTNLYAIRSNILGFGAATIANAYHYSLRQSTLGSSTITNQFGYHVENFTGATNNFGFYGDIASGTGRWNLYMNGTASNYLNGALGVGTTSMTYKFNVIDGGATYVAGFRGSSSSYIVVGDTSLAGESGVNLRNSSGQTFISQQSSNFIIGTTGSINNITFSPLSTERMRINNAGNLLIGSTTDSGERLQVTGTMKVTGASTFGGDMSYNRNTNAINSLNVINTTNGTDSQSRLNLQAGTGSIILGHRSNLTTDYKILLTNDGYLFKSGVGDIAILNDAPSGSIKMAAGGSSTAQWTIGSNGDLTAADGENIIFGTTNGTKIGTATSQKIGFWNATPIVQPTTAVASATRVGGAGNTVTDTDTYDGYTLPQIVKALRNAGLLA